MRELLTSGAVGSIELNAQKKIREDIQNRWSSLHLLDGLDGHVKETVSTLYENQAKHLIYEATTADNSGSFETVVFPLIRRVFSKLLANDVVSVQAMNMPIGKLFFIKPVTSERKLEVQDGIDTASHYGLMGYERTQRNSASGETVNRYYLPDEVINVDASGNIPEVTQYMKKSLYDLFYNDFLYDNSKGKITIRVGSVEAADILADGSYGTPTTLPICGLDDTVRNIVIAVGGFSSFRASKLTGPDGNEMDTEAFLTSLKVFCNKAIASGTVKEAPTTAWNIGDNIRYRCVTQAYGKGLVDYTSICDAEGKIYLELNMTKPVTKAGGTIDGFIGIDPAALAVAGVADAFHVAWAQYRSDARRAGNACRP